MPAQRTSPPAPSTSARRWTPSHAGLSALLTVLPQLGKDRLSLGVRQILQRRVLAQLQGTQVGDDRPAVARRNLLGVVRHRAEAVGDDLIEIADRRRTQPVGVVRGRAREAALYDDAVAVPRSAVADSAENRKPRAAALKNLARHREWKPVKI